MSEKEKNTSSAKECILKLIEEDDRWKEQDELIGVDYAKEYKKQTGKDLETGKYVAQ